MRITPFITAISLEDEINSIQSVKYDRRVRGAELFSPLRAILPFLKIDSLGAPYDLLEAPSSISVPPSEAESSQQPGQDPAHQPSQHATNLWACSLDPE